MWMGAGQGIPSGLSGQKAPATADAWPGHSGLHGEARSNAGGLWPGN